MGSGQQPYSVICNTAPSSTLPNLQIGPGANTLTDDALIMYGDAAVPITGAIQNQFSRRTGYSTTIVPASANEFVPKSFLDSSIAGFQT